MRYRRTVFLLISMATTIGLGLGSPASHAGFPGTNGRIAFVSSRDLFGEIYTMDSDGLNVMRLTNNISPDGSPRWSPDGSMITFQRDVGGNTDIYTMTSTGMSQMVITSDAATDEYPSWSPDGTQIVFDSERDGTGTDIFVMNADGSGVTQLTFETTGGNFYPAWAPDGTRIAFTKTFNGTYEIFSMKSDGTDQRRITRNHLVDEFPNW